MKNFSMKFLLHDFLKICFVTFAKLFISKFILNKFLFYYR